VTTPPTIEVDPAIGLTSAQVAERQSSGRTNNAANPRSRSVLDIVKSNTITSFNIVIGTLWALMFIARAPIQDSLFGLVIVFNSAIGIFQELRAKRTLDKLSLVGEARPVVRRDGVDVDVRPLDVVQDDVIVLRLGDQLVVDGPVLQSEGLECDESLLTGEADPVDKHRGDLARSGSFVVAGSGLMQAEQVGGAAYAAVLTAEARRFTTTSSELMGSIMKFVRTITWVLIPLGILLFISQMQSSPNWQTALSGTVAGVVTMVPEGLVLLTSIAMAVAVVRLGQKQALVQEMPAVEVLARVNVVCVDKTGTLTQPGMAVTDVVVLDSTVDIAAALGALGASEDSPNPTLAAVKASYPELAGWAADEVVPFSSARKWSAAQFTGHGWWVFGAPEMILPNGDPVRTQAEELSREGSRVLLFAQSTAAAPPSPETGVGSVRPVALVVIDQRLRPDAAETVSYFIDQGVQLKVISGDNPLTVGAIAAQARIPGADHPYDARELPDDLPGIAAVLDQFSVFGRVTPAQKRAMVGALQSQGHTVAMTGDGVNDVLALKDADLGIAMGSGAGATRAVAQIVLLNDEFSVMPSVVAEGRRVLGNIERVSDLFLTKSFYAAILSFLTVFFTLTKIYKVEFLFLPRHLTVITALSIGIPAFLLALLPNTSRFRPGFFNRVLRFSVPAGVVCAVFSFASYALALQVTDDIPASRVSAAITLFMIAWTVLFIVARPMNPIRWAIVLSMAFAFLCVLFIPWLANFFALRVGIDSASGSAVLFGLVGSAVLFIAHRWAETGRAETGGAENVSDEVSAA